MYDALVTKDDVVRSNPLLVAQTINNLRAEKEQLSGECEFTAHKLNLQVSLNQRLRGEIAEARAENKRLRKQCRAWAKAVCDNCDRETSKEIFDAQNRAFTTLSGAAE